MTPRRLAACRRALTLGVAALPLVAAAQGIVIQTPQMQPRGAAGGPGQAAGRAAAQPATSAPQAGGGSPSTSAHPAAYGPQGTHGAAPGYSGAGAAPLQGAGSPLQQRRGSGGFQQPGYAAQHVQPQHGTTAPQTAMAAAAPSASGGTCRAQPTPDRTTVSLLGPDGLPRRHVPLGDFRAHLVVHSPDGQWAVVIAKRRGEPQFAAVALDLAVCQATNTVDLPGLGEDVRFEADAAVVRTSGGERRVRLASTLVR